MEELYQRLCRGSRWEPFCIESGLLTGIRSQWRSYSKGMMWADLEEHENVNT